MLSRNVGTPYCNYVFIIARFSVRVQTQIEKIFQKRARNSTFYISLKSNNLKTVETKTNPPFAPL